MEEGKLMPDSRRFQLIRFADTDYDGKLFY